MSYKKQFAISLRKTRNSLYLDQKSFAEEMDISLSTLKNWELCISLPTQKNFSDLIDNLGSFGADMEDIRELNEVYVKAKTKYIMEGPTEKEAKKFEVM